MSKQSEFDEALKLLMEQNKELVFLTGKLSDELKAADKVIKDQRKRISELEQQVRYSVDVMDRNFMCRSM